MATAKLIGVSTDGTNNGGTAGYGHWCKFTADATGTVSEIRVQVAGNTNLKAAIYEDNAGVPGARLGYNNNANACVAGWNTITLTVAASVTAGTGYWLALTHDAESAPKYSAGSTPYRYQANIYSGGFADPAPTTISGGTYEFRIGGWGILVLSPSSTVQPISYGTPTVQLGGLVIQPSSIVQPISIGTPALLYPQTLSPPSIVQAIAYGTPQLILFIKPSSILQLIAIGTPIVKLPQLYESYLEENAFYNVYGVYWRSQSFTPQASHIITSVKLKLCRVGSPGTGTVSIKATDANGKPTGADLCSGSIDGNNLPLDPNPEKLGFSLGAGANLYAGTKYALVWRFPSGDSSNYARTRHMYPGTYAGGTAVTSSDSGATWSVVTDWDFVFEDWGESLAQTISPDSTVQAIAYGTPEVSIWGILKPTSIVQQIVIGTPTVEGGTPSGQWILPPSVVQQISFGSPTILKYVWHVILDGQYNIESPAANRAYVIGRDVYGNPVYGTAVDSTELGLVGERLDFQQELAIPTEAKAGDVASAILAKMRLTGKRGVILIPPNCGQELFDVVQITDAGANQSTVKFRVVGFRFEYSPKQARYHHKLILGAP